MRHLIRIMLISNIEADSKFGIIANTLTYFYNLKKVDDMKIKIVRNDTNIGGTRITYGDIEVICDEYEIENNFIIMKNTHIKYFKADDPDLVIGREECVEYHLPLSNIVCIRIYNDEEK